MGLLMGLLMGPRSRIALLCFLAAPFCLALAADPAPVVAGVPFRFPDDEGSHPEFRTEWWYVTGWLQTGDADAEPLGFQITFFRTRPQVAEDNPGAFAPRQLLFAHAAISDPKRGRLQHGERSARSGFGLAEAKQGHTEVWIDDWSLRQSGEVHTAQIAAQEFTLSLTFKPTQPPLVQGEQGVSRKGPDAAQASYYYSLPQLQATGSLVRDGKTASVRGAAWLDHEWSSTLLAENAVGWDWTAINLNDGGALMAFRIRDANGASLWAGGSYRSPPVDEGRGAETRIFRRDEISFTPLRVWRSPRTATEYPIRMRVQAGDLDLTLAPLFDDQEFDARASTGTIYWEGAVRAMQNGRPIGRGYLELTGYWRKLTM
ncbi:MAG: carotenoid 1,2-hydratase [Burkholderiales bacterium]|nr:carotenoid 1,2-hydratase [Burkholderiales bacterium]